MEFNLTNLFQVDESSPSYEVRLQFLKCTGIALHKLEDKEDLTLNVAGHSGRISAEKLASSHKTRACMDGVAKYIV